MRKVYGTANALMKPKQGVLLCPCTAHRQRLGGPTCSGAACWRLSVKWVGHCSSTIQVAPWQGYTRSTGLRLDVKGWACVHALGMNAHANMQQVCRLQLQNAGPHAQSEAVGMSKKK
jgi:hypothetical protein